MLLNINKDNLNDEYTIEWTTSRDPDGSEIKYHFYLDNVMYRELSDTSLTITYQELFDNWASYPNSLMKPFTFNVWVHSDNDSLKINGDELVVLVNRYGYYLSTVGEDIPTEFALHENYPNPFNPTTTLRFDLPKVSDVTLTIYNMLGQKIKTFNMNDTPAGYHSIKWDATNDYGDPVGAGVYLYQLRANEFVKTKKMVLLK
jgi:hypothetical protein